MRIIADRDLCVGSGMCVLTAEHLFGQSDEDGRVVVLSEIGPDDAEKAREAGWLCPSGALRVAEDQSEG